MILHKNIFESLYIIKTFEKKAARFIAYTYYVSFS